ncbi:hypothetical protein ABFP43_35840, partial [Burkholderia sp. RS02]
VMNRTTVTNISKIAGGIALAFALAACGGGDDKPNQGKSKPSITDPRTGAPLPSKPIGKPSGVQTSIPGKGPAGDNRPSVPLSYKVSAYSFIDAYSGFDVGSQHPLANFEDRIAYSQDGYQGAIGAGEGYALKIGIQPSDPMFFSADPDDIAASIATLDGGSVVTMCAGENVTSTPVGSSNIVSIGFLTHPIISGFDPLIKTPAVREIFSPEDFAGGDQKIYFNVISSCAAGDGAIEGGGIWALDSEGIKEGGNPPGVTGMDSNILLIARDQLAGLLARNSSMSGSPTAQSASRVSGDKNGVYNARAFITSSGHRYIALRRAVPNNPDQTTQILLVATDSPIQKLEPIKK